MSEQPQIPRSGLEKYQIQERFELANILGGPGKSGLTQGFNAVYIRTDSGNIYRVDSGGRLINANESKEKGTLVGLQLEPQLWSRIVIEIGKPFVFPNGGHTTPVTEIITTTGKTWGGEEPADSIIREFKSGLPRIPSNQPGLEGEFKN